ncbi:spore cortex biosynthesis protein YabQ [Syntrophomonas erecta]
MPGLFYQVESFILTMVLGIVTGTIFHLYQSIVRRARIGRGPLYFMDFLLWLLMIVVVFAAMLFINQGEMRVYVLIALLTGIIMYHYYFANRFDNSMKTIADRFIKGLAFVVRGVIRPVKRLRLSIRLWFKGRKEPPPDEN